MHFKTAIIIRVCHAYSFIIIHYLKVAVYEERAHDVHICAGEIALLERHIPHFYYLISDSDESHVLLL